jgi:hypothetical protein
MKNRAQTMNEGELSRRKLIKVAGAAVLAGATPLLLAKTTTDTKPVDDEKPNVFRVLAFWLAVTNPALQKHETNTLEDLTGLKDTAGSTQLADAIARVNAKPELYKSMKEEFNVIKGYFAYGGGECPKHISNLRKVADIPTS